MRSRKLKISLFFSAILTGFLLFLFFQNYSLKISFTSNTTINISSFSKEELSKMIFKVDENSIVFDPWLNGFSYRKPITISNSGSALTDYQVNVTLDTASLINLSVAKRSATGTSTSSIAISYPYQRKSFYANGLFWIFFFNGSHMVYSTSTDGITWSSPIAVRPVLDGEGFSIFFDGTYVHYAASYSTVLYYRRGTPNTDGSITWDTEQTAASGYTFRGPVIAIDSNGLPWIGYLRDDGANYYTFITSSTSSPTWNTRIGHPFQLGTFSYFTARAVPVPLTGGKVYVIYNRPNAGRLWSGSAWSSAETLDTYTLEKSMSAIAIGDDIHYVYTRAYPTWAIMYQKRTYGIGWENAVILQDNVPSTDTPFPTLTLEPMTNSLYVFWAGSPTANHIFYKKNVDGSWSNLPIDLITESTSITSNNIITSFYQVYNNKIGLIYMTGTASPYNVIFAYLTGNKMRLDCGDIRFTDSDGTTQLNYWLESGCNTALTKIWVKVPFIPAGSKTIYVYYGNPSATSQSNSDNVFLLYDSFDGTSVNTNKWVVRGTPSVSNSSIRLDGTDSAVYSTASFSPSPQLMVEAYVISHSTVSGARSGMPLLMDVNNVRFPADGCDGGIQTRPSVFFSDGRNGVVTDVGAYVTSVGGAATYAYQADISNVAHNLAIIYSSSAQQWLIDGSQVASATATLPASMYVGLATTCTATSQPIVIDWIRVRKYTSPEPTTSVGTEDVLITQSGSPTSWSWKVPASGEQIKSGSATSWTWKTFTDDGTGIVVPKGSATSWRWGP
jgi:hypothetical protein